MKELMQRKTKRPTFRAALCLAAMALCLCLPACQGKKSNTPPGQAGKQPANLPAKAAPAFNADSAYRFAAEQVAFGPRIPNSEAQRQCARYLEGKLASYGAVVQVQEFQSRRWDGMLLDGYNIIASFNPSQTQRILLCAHWDSRPYADHDPDPARRKEAIDGANDGASGTAVLLEIGRLMEQDLPDVGVDIILFDLEDSGKPEWEYNQAGDEYTWALGSQYWAGNPHIPGYNALYGILLDMVGTESPCFVMEATSMYYAPDIMRKVWDKASALGYGHIFQNRPGGALIDDHLFINEIAGIPTIDIIHYDGLNESGFFPYWHTKADNMGSISASTLKIVGDVVLAVIYEE